MQYRLIPNLILHAKLDTNTIEDLKTKASAAPTVFHPVHTLPHDYLTHKAATSAQSANDYRLVQQMAGESISKLQKVSIKGVCNSIITDKAAIEAACANTTAILHTLCEFDPTTVDFKLAPIKHVCNRMIGLALSTAEYAAHKRKKACTKDLQYWLFDLKCRVEATLARALDDEDIIDAAHPKNGTSLAKDVDSSVLLEAHTMLIEGMNTFFSMCSGRTPVEKTTIFLNSPFNPEVIAAAAAAAVVSATPAIKKRSSDTTPDTSERKKAKRGEDTPGKERYPGAIIVKNKQDKITFPDDYPEDEKRLCPGILRNNRRIEKKCSNNQCDLWHEPNPKHWPVRVKAALKRHVLANSDKFEWNPKIMTPELFGLEYQKDKKV